MFTSDELAAMAIACVYTIGIFLAVKIIRDFKISAEYRQLCEKLS